MVARKKNKKQANLPQFLRESRDGATRVVCCFYSVMPTLANKYNGYLASLGGGFEHCVLRSFIIFTLLIINKCLNSTDPAAAL